MNQNLQIHKFNWNPIFGSIRRMRNLCQFHFNSFQSSFNYGFNIEYIHPYLELDRRFWKINLRSAKCEQRNWTFQTN